MYLPAIYDVDISKPLLPTPLQQMLITRDRGANRIIVRLFKGHVPFFPHGTCLGFAVRRDGMTVPIENGVIDGNTMYIDLTADVYAIEGPVNIGVKNVDGGAETTVFLGLGMVSLGETDVIIDPGTIIPSVAALMAQLRAAIATIPPEYSELLATIAPVFSDESAYAAGDYCWYSGVLYRFTAAHPAGNWTGNDAEEAVACEELSNIKRSLGIETYTAWVSGKAYKTDGTAITPGTPASNSSIACLCLPCAAGDVFTIYLYNGFNANYRPWAFFDSEGALVSAANNNAGWYENIVVTAPENAAYIVFNTSKSRAYKSIVYKGRLKQDVLTFDSAPALGSTNPVTSDGVYKANEFTADGGKTLVLSDYPLISCTISATNTMTRSGDRYKSRQIPRGAFWESVFVEAQEGQATSVTFVKTALPTTPEQDADMSGSLATGETGRHLIPANMAEYLEIPDDAAYIVITVKSSDVSVTPASTLVYTQSGGKIKALEEAMQDKASNIFPSAINWAEMFSTGAYQLGWRPGYYAMGSGATGTSNDYMRSVNPKYFKAQYGDLKLVFSVPVGYHACVTEYNASDVWQATYGNYNNGENSVTVTLTEGYRYRFTIGNFGGDVEDSLTEEFVSGVTATVYQSLESWQRKQDERLAALEVTDDITFPRSVSWPKMFGETNHPLGWQSGYYNASGNASSDPDKPAIRTIKSMRYVARQGDEKLVYTVPLGNYAAVIEWDENGANGTRYGKIGSGENTLTIPLTAGHKYAFVVSGLSGDPEDYLTAEYLANVTAVIYRSLLSWQEEQDARLDSVKETEDIPAYYTENGYLQGRLDAITARQNTMSANQDAFWFISDTHHQYNQGNSFALLKWLADRSGIRKMFFAGDAGGSQGSQLAQVYHRIQRSALAWAEYAACVDEYYGVLGNHEWIHTGTQGAGTFAGMMGAYLNRYKTQVDGFDPVTGCYYVDNIGSKIRYFFIQSTNSAAPVSGALAWLYAQLLEVPADYSITLTVHHGYIPSAATEAEYDGAEITYNYYSIKGMSQLLAGCRDKTSVTVGSTTYDFTGLTGDRHIIGVFCGHFHHGYLYTESNVAGIENIAVFRGSTDGLSAASVAINKHPWYWQDGIVGGTKIERLPGTTDEQCFYCVQVDLDAKMLYITAIGGDHDWDGVYEPST